MSTSPTSPPFFDRLTEIQLLEQRLVDCPTGITLVSGPPQMGKSRLLNRLVELQRRLGPESRQLIGIAEAGHAEPDVLLRCLSDLYQHWLGTASFVEQARKLWAEGRNTTAFERFGKPIAEGLAALITTVEPTGMLGNQVRALMQKLAKADRDLRQGPVELAPLSHARARDLLRTLHELSGAQCVLVLDAFEQSSHPARDSGNLRTFLGDVDTWPPTHFVVGVRDPARDSEMPPEMRERDAWHELVALEQASAAVARIELGPVDLDASGERETFSSFVREQVPGAAGVDTDRLVEMFDGYPGTLDRWLWVKPTSAGELESLRKDAQALLFRELPDLFARLQGNRPELFEIAVRLTILPEILERDTWNRLEPHVLAGQPAVSLDELQAAGFLRPRDDDPEIPWLGSTVRHQAAGRALLAGPWPRALRSLTEELVLSVAADYQFDDVEAGQHVEPTLTALTDVGREVRASEAVQALCRLPSTLRMETEDPSFEEIDLASSLATENPEIAPLCSLALSNYVLREKRGTELLPRMRELCALDPERTAESLAQGLCAAAQEAEDPRERWALWREIRDVGIARPGWRAPWVMLAPGLASTILDADESEVHEALKMLREITAETTGGWLLEQYWVGLVNAICSDVELDRTALHDELVRSIDGSEPLPVPISLGGMLDRMADAGGIDPQALAWRGQALDENPELRAAVERLADPGAQQEVCLETLSDPSRAILTALAHVWLARPWERNDEDDEDAGLVTLEAAIGAEASPDSEHEDAFDELAEWATWRPYWHSPVEHRARALFGLVQHDNERWADHVEALSELAAFHPEDAAAQRFYAEALQHVAINREDANIVAVLEILEPRAHLFYEVAEIREALAWVWAEAPADDLPEDRDRLAELRELAQTSPEDAEVAFALALGLVGSLPGSTDPESVVAEVRDLAARHPEEERSGVMVRTVLAAAIEAHPARADAWLDELRRTPTTGKDGVRMLAVSLSALALERGPAVLEELRELARAHESEPEIVETLARGTLRFWLARGEIGANAVLELVEAFPDHPVDEDLHRSAQELLQAAAPAELGLAFERLRVLTEHRGGRFLESALAPAIGSHLARLDAGVRDEWLGYLRSLAAADLPHRTHEGYVVALALGLRNMCVEDEQSSDRTAICEELRRLADTAATDEGRQRVRGWVEEVCGPTQG